MNEDHYRHIIETLTEIREEIKRMSTQITQLNSAVDADTEAVNKLQTDVATIEQELQAAQQNQGVDLTAVIAKVQALGASIGAIDTGAVTAGTPPTAGTPATPAS